MLDTSTTKAASTLYERTQRREHGSGSVFAHVAREEAPVYDTPAQAYEPTPNFPAVRMLDVYIQDVSATDLVDFMVRTAKASRKALISYVNVHAMNLAVAQPRFRDFLNRSDVAFCDGVGIQWGARLLQQHIRHRNTPPDWMPLLSSSCAQHGLSMYLLGARPGVAHEAAMQLQKYSPGLQIAGTHHGYFDKAPRSAQSEEVLSLVNSAKPNILLVGFGMPIQEYWLDDHWDHLDVNIAMPVGALFDYLARRVYRAPQWITDNGLEWLARLLVEPQRLWKRYLIGNPLFLWRVLRQRIGQY